MNLPEHQLPDFSGKIVMFYLIDTAPDFALTLVSPTFELQGDRLFVAGESAAQRDTNWDRGLRGAIGWDQVRNYLVFESFADYESRVLMFDAKKHVDSKGVFSAFRR